MEPRLREVEKERTAKITNAHEAGPSDKLRDQI
jgi:hypothetical protein